MADQRFIDATSLKVRVTRYCEVKARSKRRKAFREYVSELCRDICLAVDAEPTAAVRENKHGHWIETEDGGLQCSECGRITGEVIDEYEPLNADLTSAKYGFTIPKGSPIWALKHPYFCAKCGADMREVDTDD